MQFSYFKKPVTNNKPLKSVTVEELADLIRSDSFKTITEKLQSIGKTNPDGSRNKDFDKLKNSGLDSAALGGEFTIRRKSGVNNINSAFWLDFDGIDPVHVPKIREELEQLKDDYLDTLILFRSVSAGGLKWGVRVADKFKTVAEYEQHFKKVILHIKKEYPHIAQYLDGDFKQKDVTRLAYICYDPDVYVNGTEERELKPLTIEYSELDQGSPKDIKPSEHTPPPEEQIKALTEQIQYYLIDLAPEEGSHTNELTSLIGWCNSHGINKDYLLVFLEKNRKLFSKGSKLDNWQHVEYTVNDIYERYSSEFNTKEIFKSQEVTPDTPKDEFLSFEVTPEYEVKHREPAIMLRTPEGKDNFTLIKHTDIFTLIAPPAYGKSGLCEIFTAAYTAQKKGLKSDDLQFIFNTDDRQILWLDTERSRDDIRISIDRVIANLEEYNDCDGTELFKENISVRAFAEITSSEQAKNELEKLVETGKYSFVLIDGILDIAPSLNDEIGVKQTISFIRGLAKKYDFSIITTIHPNAGSNGDAAGHLGKMLHRYSRAMFAIITTKDNIKIKTFDGDFLNNKTIKFSYGSWLDMPEIYFGWDDEKRRLTSQYKPEAANFNPFALRNCFKGSHRSFPLPSKVFKERYGEQTGLKISGMRPHISAAIEAGFINANGNGKSKTYELVAEQWEILEEEQKKEALAKDSLSK